MTLAIQRIVLVSLVITNAPLLAATPPPQSPYSEQSWNSVSEKMPAAGLTMGSFRVQFEKTTLATILKVAGRGEISHRGDAAESIYWLCYTVENTKQSERIWIIAHGEMGGSEHAVTLISAQTIESAQAQTNKDCPALPATLQPVSFDENLWLGTPEERALKILGRPSHKDGSWWSFDYQGKVPGDCEGNGFDLVNWLLFKSSKERLVDIRAGQITSC